MFKKLLAVALAILATLMIVSCQQPNNAPTENVDPNMPEKIYKNPEMYNTLKMVLQTRVGDTDFYLITDNNVPPFLLGFMHTEDKTKDQTPYIAEKIYVGGTFITEMKGYVTKENVYADKRTDIIFVPSVLDITGTKNLYAEDPNEMTQNYAGWAAIVPADPKANTPEKAKISDSIYVIYNEGLSDKDKFVSGEKDNISTLAGYGIWNVCTNYVNLKDVLPKMSEETQKFQFDKTL